MYYIYEHFFIYILYIPYILLIYKLCIYGLLEITTHLFNTCFMKELLVKKKESHHNIWWYSSIKLSTLMFFCSNIILKFQKSNFDNWYVHNPEYIYYFISIYKIHMHLICKLIIFGLIETIEWLLFRLKIDNIIFLYLYQNINTRIWQMEIS